jgi:hypothetical protein
MGPVGPIYEGIAYILRVIGKALGIIRDKAKIFFVKLAIIFKEAVKKMIKNAAMKALKRPCKTLIYYLKIIALALFARACLMRGFGVIFDCDRYLMKQLLWFIMGCMIQCLDLALVIIIEHNEASEDPYVFPLGLARQASELICGENNN